MLNVVQHLPLFAIGEAAVHNNQNLCLILKKKDNEMTLHESYTKKFESSYTLEKFKDLKLQIQFFLLKKKKKVFKKKSL